HAKPLIPAKHDRTGPPCILKRGGAMSRAFTGWGRGSRPAMAEGEGGGVAVACRPLPSHRASCRGTSAAVQKSASLSRRVRTMMQTSESGHWRTRRPRIWSRRQHAFGPRCMITLPEMAAEALGQFLASDVKDRFGSSHARLAEIIPFAAKLALECNRQQRCALPQRRAYDARHSGGARHLQVPCAV